MNTADQHQQQQSEEPSAAASNNNPSHRATPEAAQQPPPEGGGSKRKRVSLACNACRLRKSKCDGVRPRCSMCRDLDFDCVYQQSASSANTIVGKDYIGRLETRLLAVEKLLAAQTAAMSSRGFRHKSEEQDDDDSRDKRGPNGKPPKGIKRKRSNSPCVAIDTVTGETMVNLKNGELEDDDSTPDTVLDGMGALVVGDDEDYGYFGPSSNIAFIGHVTRALATTAHATGAFSKDLRHSEAAMGGHSQPITPGHEGHLDEGGEFDIRPGNLNPYVLPAEPRVRRLVNLYFQNTNILFPYLHRPTFLATYEASLENGFTKVRRTWLALLNLVMAMGSRASAEADLTTEDRGKSAEIFYQRGYALCNEHLLRLASLDSVHVLLLMSHYLQSTKKPVQCWSTHGLAIRVAIQMGLHSSQALQRFPPLERELRKRAWYGCVLLDRTLSLTFGRPSAIAAYAEQLDLPLDIEDEDLKPSMMTPTVVPHPNSCTSVTFFIMSIKLYTLLGRIIDTLYGGNLGGADSSGPTFSDVARVAEIEEKLSQWRENLPQALSIVSPSDIPEGGGPRSQFWRQSIILSLRYYNTRALLHRQFAVKALSELWGAGPSANKFEGEFFWNFGLASISTCSDSATATIEIVHKVKHRSDLLGFWWFTCYYAFNASLVLVSKVLIVSQVRQLRKGRGESYDSEEMDSLLKHLDMAMEILEVLTTNNRITNRCRIFLKNLMRYVVPLAAASPRPPPALPVAPTASSPSSSSATYNPAPSMSMSFSPAGAPPTAEYLAAPQQHMGQDETGRDGIPPKSPFKTQPMGEFMLESDFTYLHSILPPLGMGEMDGGVAGGGYGPLAGFVG